MTVLREFNPSTGFWDPIFVGEQGPQGVPGPPGTTDGVFNVKDFGAVGDGVANDTAAIQAAIDAAAAGSGGKVTGPAGTYMVSTLNIKSHVDLEFSAGTVLKQIAGTNANLIQTVNFTADNAAQAGGGPHHFRIANVRLDGNQASNAGGYCIAVYGYTYRLENIHIADGGGGGIYSRFDNPGGLGFRDGNETMWNAVTVYYCDGDGVRMCGPADSTMSNCIFAQNTGRQLVVESPGATIEMSNVHTWASNGVASPSVFSFEAYVSVQATNCYFEGDAPTAGALLVVANGSIFNNCRYQVFQSGQVAVQLGVSGTAAGQTIVTGQVSSIASGAIGVKFVNEAASMVTVMATMTGAALPTSGTPHISSQVNLTTFGVGTPYLALPRGFVRPQYISFENGSVHPADPIAAESNIYEKGGKLIIQYNDGGTIRYKYLELYGGSVTWIHTTTAP